MGVGSRGGPQCRQLSKEVDWHLPRKKFLMAFFRKKVDSSAKVSDDLSYFLVIYHKINLFFLFKSFFVCLLTCFSFLHKSGLLEQNRAPGQRTL